MPLLNYKKYLAGKVESGEKRTTIRAYRKDGKDPKVGQTLYHYVGIRTKGCRKLLETECKSVLPIQMIRNGFHIEIILNQKSINQEEIEKIAKMDGFDCIQDFFDFFETTHGFPFHGLLIEW